MILVLTVLSNCLYDLENICNNCIVFIDVEKIVCKNIIHFYKWEIDDCTLQVTIIEEQIRRVMLVTLY